MISGDLQIRTEQEFQRAIDEAIERNFINPREFIRQAALDRLKEKAKQ